MALRRKTRERRAVEGWGRGCAAGGLAGSNNVSRSAAAVGKFIIGFAAAAAASER